MSDLNVKSDFLSNLKVSAAKGNYPTFLDFSKTLTFREIKFTKIRARGITDKNVR